MEVKQIYTIVNNALSESVGTSALLTEDLSNVVDAGNAIFDNGSFDAFSGKLVDHVGRMVFVDRKYSGFGYSLMRDGWEYGAVLQKVSSEIPKATQNESYQLVNGASYDPHEFYGTPVEAKFYNKYVTFEIDKSITERQLRSAFSSANELNAFVSMIYNEIDKGFTVALVNLARRTVNNMMGEVINAGGVNAINLLSDYNSGPNAGGTALTATLALSNLEFLKYAAYRIGQTSDRMAEISTLFNVGGKERFTPRDMQKIILLSDFRRAADAYLQADTFHNEFVKLPEGETTAYWQGSGTGYALADVSAIDVTTTGGNTVNQTYILGCIFDRDAAGINCMERWVRTQPNAKADFTNYFYKMKAQYFNDLNENCVVFYMA